MTEINQSRKWDSVKCYLLHFGHDWSDPVQGYVQCERCGAMKAWAWSPPKPTGHYPPRPLPKRRDQSQ